MTSKLKKTLFYKIALNFKRRFDKYYAQRIEISQHPKRIAFYQSFLNSKDLVFDVGANIGNRVKVFLDLGCRVIAIEPQPKCVSVLKKKFLNLIEIEQVGLGSEPGKMDMFIADETTISTFSKEFIDKTKDNKFKNNKWTSKISVPITTLDHLIAKYGVPSFCKIDVEGFESEVLSGLSKPLPNISFEYNVPELAKNVESSIEKLNSLSTNYSYNFSIGESMKFVLDDWIKYDQFKKVVSSPEFLNSDFGDIYATLLAPNK